MLDIIKDTLIDGIKLLPFLFIAFLIIELVEHKLSNKTQKIITKSNKYGPVLGSLFGAFPQCGFSVLATNLYVTREGFLTICCADKRNYLAVANLNECSLEEAWNCDAVVDFRKGMLSGKVEGTLCYNCIYGREEEVFPIVDKYSSNYISCDYNKDRLERIEQLKVLDKIK